MAKVGKVILAVTKGGGNLLAVAKLLFRLSKTSVNDEILRGEGISQAIVSALLGAGRLESVLGHIARLSDQCEQVFCTCVVCVCVCVCVCVYTPLHPSTIYIYIYRSFVAAL